LVLPGPLAVPVLQERKAQPERRAFKGPRQLARLVPPDLPVNQARKAQLARRVHKAPLA
jgi:hypothetical protein